MWWEYSPIKSYIIGFSIFPTVPYVNRGKLRLNTPKAQDLPIQYLMRRLKIRFFKQVDGRTDGGLMIEYLAVKNRSHR